MNVATWIQILSKTVCISDSTNTSGKSMTLTILPSAMGKIVRLSVLFNLGMATNLREFKPVKLCLKIELVSHPAHTEA